MLLASKGSGEREEPRCGGGGQRGREWGEDARVARGTEHRREGAVAAAAAVAREGVAHVVVWR
jgi:hypothetical protein